MIIAQNKLGTTVYHKKEEILVSVYKGRITTGLALNHLAEIVEFYKNNNVLGSVVDIKEMYGSFAKIFGYMKDTYYPVAVKRGLKCQSFVVSEDLIINNLSSKLKGMATSFKLKAEIFSERGGAEIWVKSNVNPR
ncbi:MAG: hypothetical protein L3J06_02015 [Cyclobacteriaceae bacterium]|nr:hypothetical protein [Cyclobacteriaceae bacterium]